MMSLWKLTKRDLLSHVATVSLERFFLISLLMLLIIQKSKFIILFHFNAALTHVFPTHAWARVLLVTLKFLANCPCTRCLVEKAQIFAMGSKRDMKQHWKKEWVDSRPRQISVRDAHRQIFEFGHPVNSVVVEGILGNHLGVPTQVHIYHVCTEAYWLLINPIECLFYSFSSF